MAILFQEEKTYDERLKEQLGKAFVRSATASAQDRFNERREHLAETTPHWQELVAQAAAIRAHTLDHLDAYLAQFFDRAERNGAVLHFCPTAKDAAEAVLKIIADAKGKSVVKSKSMLTEEINLNKVLLSHGIEVTETDLGEWILQLDDWDAPSHILGPATHKDREEVYNLFVKNGYTGTKDIPEMARFARGRLREKFLAADVGITGCNFAIAETGTVSIMTNEGNGRMVTTLPKTQIVVMGLERLVPTLSDFEAIMQVFPRSAVGVNTSSYLSLTSGPRGAGELDGPEALHIIVLDNGRTDILASDFRDMLRCIRCGTCQNVCPVYRHATGHSYGSIYAGPMGVVLTPLLTSYEAGHDLIYASTLCGECSDNCPVQIPLHELILRHRQQWVASGAADQKEASLMRAAGWALAGGRRFHMGTRVGGLLMPALAWRHGGDHLDERSRLPVLGRWTASRHFPLLARPGFRDVMRKRNKETQKVFPAKRGERHG